MGEATRRWSSIASSGGLAVLTLAVFFLSAYAGPRSTVMRFFEAVRDRNAEELQSTLLQSIETSPEALLLIREAQAVIASRGTLNIVRTSEIAEGRAVLVDGVFSARGFRPINRVWVVVRTRDGWRIDSVATQQVLAMPSPNG